MQGEPGFLLAHQVMGRALRTPGASVHWYDKPGWLYTLSSLFHTGHEN